jgi:voltage-gated potassium channel
MSEPQEHPNGPAIRWLDRRARRRGLRPRDAAFLIVAVWLVAVIVFGIVEHFLDDRTFPTVWLGMWWALQTVTTVGYGDVTPQNASGRIVAATVMLEGIALLTIVIAAITSTFIARAARERAPGEALVGDEAEARIEARLEDLAQRLDRLERLVLKLTDE